MVATTEENMALTKSELEASEAEPMLPSFESARKLTITSATDSKAVFSLKMTGCGALNESPVTSFANVDEAPLSATTTRRLAGTLATH